VPVHVGADRERAPARPLETAAAPAGYALEGAILASGAALQWLRDGLGILGDAAESEVLAREVDSTGGVHFVPALTGLGSPHWRPDARGLITGLTRGTTRAHLVRAALEAIAFQVADVLEAFPSRLEVLRADGGASENGFLMQFQADLLGCPVEVATERETTALGAAVLAGRTVGLWPDDETIRSKIPRGAVYEPAGDRDELERMRSEWGLAVRRALLA
jgi:glycerol kinase